MSTNNNFDATFDSFTYNFTVPILKDQHLVFIETANRYVNASLSNGSSAGSSHYAVVNKITGFEEASPGLHLLSSKAIHRLGLWIDTLVASKRRQGGELSLPPLDVLIMLNAYILSPRPFLEDIRVRDLPELQAFPIKEIVTRINNGEYRPTRHDMESWMQTVKVPFDVAQIPEFVDIRCPRCAGTLRVNWEGPNGNGYGQEGFRTGCPSCPRLTVNHDALCAGKFLTDFTECQRDKNCVLKGTLLDNKGVRDDIAGGRVIVDELVKILGKASRNDLGDEFSWSMEAILDRLKNAKDTRMQTNLIRDHLRPYLNGSPFTADLIKKAFSYIDFSESFRKGGWFDGSKDEAFKVKALTAAVEDYRKFIRIVSETNKMGFVSHELDVVWHAHQLIGVQTYRSQTIELTGTLLDHLAISYSADTAGAFTSTRAINERTLTKRGPPGPWKPTLAEVDMEKIAANLHAPTSTILVTAITAITENIAANLHASASLFDP
ncbi:hypothetical protein FRB97_004802 [Tulasnella sp. 331]|nr:hypothetical protein FRB97_004802 [Tulasnella sp. 331]